MVTGENRVSVSSRRQRAVISSRIPCAHLRGSRRGGGERRAVKNLSLVSLKRGAPHVRDDPATRTGWARVPTSSPGRALLRHSRHRARRELTAGRGCVARLGGLGARAERTRLVALGSDGAPGRDSSAVRSRCAPACRGAAAVAPGQRDPRAALSGGAGLPLAATRHARPAAQRARQPRATRARPAWCLARPPARLRRARGRSRPRRRTPPSSRRQGREATSSCFRSASMLG